MDESLSLIEIFRQHEGRLIDKWDHYFPIYERHFSRFRGLPVRILEIGVYHGGSLQMWKKYFGDKATLIGVDIDPRCAESAEERVDIEIGDQSDPKFWLDVLEKHGNFDIVIDDGSHIAGHQLAAFDSLWPQLADGGVYLVEDTHCAYWQTYGGGLGAFNTFVDFARERVDDLHAFWARDASLFPVTRYTREIGALSFYDSVVVMEKQLRNCPPTQLMSGQPSRPMSESEIEVVRRAHIMAKSG
jgi:hypothetical protein